ncbi:MAG: DUF3883 domain-containing protein, partial [Planctomycetaceae bacterium]
LPVQFKESDCPKIAKHLKWLNYVPDGVEVKGLNAIPVHEIQKAVFEIPESLFATISTAILKAQASSLDDSTSSDEPDEADDGFIQAFEISQAKSQGFLLDSNLRKALEDYSMAAATQHFASEGYDVKDHSKNYSYDLLCQRGNELLYIEVKGTQTSGKCVFLTSGEVEFATRNKDQMVLFLFHSIEVSEDKKILANGKKKMIRPWDVARGTLNPFFKYDLPRDDNRE